MLERCQLEENPLPLLLTLPSLSCITIRTPSRGSTEASLPVLMPMRRPQQQLLLHPGSSTGGRGRGACTQAHTRAAVVPAGSDVGEAGACFVNTSITSLSLVEVGLRHLPGCISQLVALEELQLALNHDMALNPATCLPQELTCLSGRCGATAARAARHSGAEQDCCACSRARRSEFLVHLFPHGIIRLQERPGCMMQPVTDYTLVPFAVCMQASSHCALGTAACTTCRPW